MNKYPSKCPNLDDLGPEKHKISKKECSECEKVLFTSKHEARNGLVGHLASKSMRVYECPHHKGQFHLTKNWKNKKRST